MVSLFAIGVICGVVGILLLAYWARLYRVLRRRGDGGRGAERAVATHLRESLNKRLYHVLNDVTLRDRIGSTQIDHIVVSRFGIFVIETKDYAGTVKGKAEDLDWVQQVGERKRSFQNPLNQNYGHIKAITNRTKLPGEYFRSVVVFSERGGFAGKLPEEVVKHGDLIAHISGFDSEVIPYGKMLEAIGSIEMAREPIGKETDKRHLEDLKRRHGQPEALEI